MDLVPIKILLTLGTKPGARMVYPDFNSACASVLEGQDWAVYCDKFGGPHYDHESKMKEAANDVPHGQQYVMYLVEEAFADLAVAAFPDLVERLDETEAEDFHDNRAHRKDPEEKLDENVLAAMRAKLGVEGDLTKIDKRTLSIGDKNALDPEHPAPGIIRNRRKHFTDLKASLGATILEKPE